MILLILTAVAFLVIVVSSIYNRSQTHGLDREVKQIHNARMRETGSKILAVVPNLSPLQLEQLRSQAYVPQRIIFLTHQRQPAANHKHIRVHNVINWGGTSTAIYQLLSQGYKGESYICILSEDFVPFLNWDVILERSLLQGRAHLVTQFCGSDKSRQEATFPCLDSRTSPDTAIPQFIPRYYVSSGFLHDSPSLTTSCLFGSAGTMKILLQFPVPWVSEDEQSFIIMNLAHYASLRIVCPYRSVGWRRGNLPNSGPSQKRDTSLRDQVLKILTQPLSYYGEGKEFPRIIEYMESLRSTRPQQPYLQWLGYSSDKKTLKGCWLLGVPELPSAQELQHKYGSVRKFRELRGRYCYD